MTWSNSRQGQCGTATPQRPLSERWRPISIGQREAEANAIPELLAALTEQITAWRRL